MPNTAIRPAMIDTVVEAKNDTLRIGLATKVARPRAPSAEQV
jgi:hypothetical protein